MGENKTYRILAINPGSTSTKIGIYDGETKIVEKVVRHQREELDACGGVGVYNQKGLRKKMVLDCLAENGIELSSIDATVGRASRLPPMHSGTYQVNDALMAAVPDPLVSAALLGMIIAREIGDEFGIPSFIVDPTNVDEFCEEARITGIPEIRRVSMPHALNQKAMARRASRDLGKEYKETRLVVAHMGGGISVGAHLYGEMIDSTRGDDGEGPFSPERSGYVPERELIQMCFSGKYTQAEMENFFIRKGGMLLYFGTSDMREIEAMVKSGDEKAKLYFSAMVYNIAKTIGSMYAVLDSKADAIVLTGGLSYSELFIKMLTDKISGMAPVLVYPGEDELLSMVQGTLRVLTGQETAMVFEA